MNNQSISNTGITAEWVQLTRQYCQQLVTPEIQRHVKFRNLKKIENALRSGEFITNGEPIILCENGTLIDGQHRIQAFMRTGIFPEALIVSGVILDNETPKRFVANVTNYQTLKAIYGKEPDGWLGKKVTLTPTETKFGAKMTPCIRVKNIDPATGKAPTAF